MPPKSDKRERLLKAARRLIHQQGFQRTTLADIAEQSGVPLGNVYYYFRTKDEIVRAVIEDRTQRFLALAEGWEQDPDPGKRLHCFLEMPVSIDRSIAAHGCPVGSLSQELSKKGDGHAELAGQTLRAQLDWVTEQFRLLGRADAELLGHQFIATLQGSSLLANTLNRPEVLIEQVERLKQWVQSFSAGEKGGKTT